MNLPNKLTIARIVMAVLIIIILLGGDYTVSLFGFEIPKLFINETIVVDLKYIISGFLFIIASLTDFLDGYIARKYNLITDFGKLIDAIADKILVNSVLIILAAQGFIHPIIPVVIIIRDSVVNSIKMLAASNGKVVAAIKSGKIKTACLMVGIVLTLFYNLPFELWNISVAKVLLFIATILSITSGVQYFALNKHLIKDK
ncbi:MAG: CDP-diacylglycerol--glycerol-3-phosphate 3-phosphatidyltransferase [Firmicutes bacterium]|nr:CDP-diacylglycerol--glycerol-3-phosphate 3-phosphatidyltransferase [Bacillota bacterium]